MIEWVGNFAVEWLRKFAEKHLTAAADQLVDSFWRWRTRWMIRAASGRKVAILVAKVEGDTAENSLRKTLYDTIRREFGRAVEIIQWPEPLPDRDGHEFDAEFGAYATARKWLAQKNGDLLIAGRDKGRNAHGERVLSLQFISTDTDEPPPASYKLNDTLDLPVNFMSDLGAAVAARVTMGVTSADDASLNSLSALRISAARLQPIVERLNPAFDADTRGSLLFNYALVRDRIGDLAKTNEDLLSAVDAYRKAVKEWTRERVPDSWAMAQNNLGNTLRRLSEREDSTPRLRQGIAALRASLEETTPERDLLRWAGAHFNLGLALRELDAREGGTAHLAGC